MKSIIKLLTRNDKIIISALLIMFLMMVYTAQPEIRMTLIIAFVFGGVVMFAVTALMMPFME